MNLGWLRAAAWCLGWMVLALLPMAIAMIGERPPAREFLVEVGVMLGLLGLGVLAAQAVSSGRQRWFAAGLGQDDLLQFHRQTGLFALSLILAHPLTLFVADPAFLTYLDPRDEALRAVSLSLVLLASMTLVASSLWRLTFGLSYEHWRLLHGLLFVFIVASGLGHALMVDHYSAGIATKAALVILVGASLYLVLDSRLRRPLRMQRQPYRVREVRHQRGDCSTLVLTPERGTRMQFRPGQFVWLTLGDTPWQLQQHPFSFVSSADNEDLEFTIKNLGDFTSTVPDTAPGTRAWLEGPYGVFTCDLSQCKHGAVFIAGGVGITPVMSILRTARDRKQKTPLWLIYGSECWSEVIFREELDALAHELPLTLVHVLQEGHDEWQGETGYIDGKLLDRHLPENIAELPCYICGPDAMADEVEPHLLKRGVPARQLYSERFDMV